ARWDRDARRATLSGRHAEPLAQRALWTCNRWTRPGAARHAAVGRAGLSEGAARSTGLGSRAARCAKHAGAAASTARCDARVSARAAATARRAGVRARNAGLGMRAAASFDRLSVTADRLAGACA